MYAPTSTRETTLSRPTPASGRHVVTRLRGGFTLIEVLVVVAIIGIAGAVVVPQMLKSSTLTVQAAGRMVIADLLYAQNEAIAQQRPRRLVFDVDGNSYRMTDDQDNTLQASWRDSQGSGNYVINFSKDSRFAGVRLKNVDFGGEKYVEYDALGAPAQGGSLDLVTDNVTYRVTVSPFTGRVVIAPVP